MTSTADQTYRFHFTSTLQDLLDAEAATRSRRLREPYRWALVALGVAWVTGGVFVGGTWARSLLWVLLGLGVLYCFAVRPHRLRARIVKDNVVDRDVTLDFTPSQVTIDVSGVGQFTRMWHELVDVIETDDGILFYFEDAVVNWLPRRVFESAAVRSEFTEFVTQQQTLALGRSG